MALPLLVKVGEIRRHQHRRASPWWAAEQGSLQPVFVPILPERPRDSGSFSSLQILVNGSKTDRATAGDLPQPQAHIKLQSKNFFDLAHRLCSREHNPCNVPARIMCPERRDVSNSGGARVSRPHNATATVASSAGWHRSASEVFAESSRLRHPALCIFPKPPAWYGE